MQWHSSTVSIDSVYHDHDNESNNDDSSIVNVIDNVIYFDNDSEWSNDNNCCWTNNNIDKWRTNKHRCINSDDVDIDFAADDSDYRRIDSINFDIDDDKHERWRRIDDERYVGDLDNIDRHFDDNIDRFDDASLLDCVARFVGFVGFVSNKCDDEKRKRKEIKKIFYCIGKSVSIPICY